MLNSTHWLIAYTLELRYFFCSSAAKATSEECDAWRKRTLQLEAELYATRAAAKTHDVGTSTVHSSFCPVVSTFSIEQLMVKPLLPCAEDDATKPTPSVPKSRGRPPKKRPKTSHARKSQALESPTAATERPQVKDISPRENSAFLCRPPS